MNNIKKDINEARNGDAYSAIYIAELIYSGKFFIQDKDLALKMINVCCKESDLLCALKIKSIMYRKKTGFKNKVIFLYTSFFLAFKSMYIACRNKEDPRLVGMDWYGDSKKDYTRVIDIYLSTELQLEFNLLLDKSELTIID